MKTKLLVLSLICALAFSISFSNTALSSGLDIVSTYSEIYDGWHKYPCALTVDTDGDILAAQIGDYGRFIVKMDNSLNLISETSTSYNGAGGIIVLSNGDIVVTDCPKHGWNPPTGNHRVVKLDPDFNLIATFGSKVGSDKSRLYNPNRLASDRFDNVYVSTAGGSGRLVKLSPDLEYITEYQTNFRNITAIAIKGDYVYVSSYDGTTLILLDLDLNETGISGKIGTFGVQDIAVDDDGNVYAGTNSNITFLDSGLNIIAVFNDKDWFRNIHGIAIGNDGAIYVSSRYKGIAKLSKPTMTVKGVLDVKPDTLNLKSKGRFVTCYIELPIDYYIQDIDIYSLILSTDSDISLDPTGPSGVGDYDNDGAPDLMVKFDAQELISLLESGNVEIAVSGELIDGTMFEANDTIRVINKGKK